MREAGVSDRSMGSGAVEPSSWPRPCPRTGGAWRGRSGGLGMLWVTLGFAAVLLWFSIAAGIGGADIDAAAVSEMAVVSITLIVAFGPGLVLARLQTLRRVGVGRRLPVAATRHGVDDALWALGGLLLAAAGLAAVAGAWASIEAHGAAGLVTAAHAAAAAAWPLAAVCVMSLFAAVRAGVVAVPTGVALGTVPTTAAVAPVVLVRLGAEGVACSVALGTWAGVALLQGALPRGLQDWLQRVEDVPSTVRVSRLASAWTAWLRATGPFARPLTGHEQGAGFTAGVTGASLMVPLTQWGADTPSLLQPLGSTMTAGHGLRLLLLTAVVYLVLRSGEVHWRLRLAPGGHAQALGRRIVMRTTVTVCAWVASMWLIMGFAMALFDARDAAGQAWTALTAIDRILLQLMPATAVDLWLAAALAAGLRAMVPSMLVGIGVLGGVVAVTVIGGLLVNHAIGGSLLVPRGHRDGAYLIVHAVAAAVLTAWADRLWRRVVNVDALQPGPGAPPWRRPVARAFRRADDSRRAQ